MILAYLQLIAWFVVTEMSLSFMASLSLLFQSFEDLLFQRLDLDWLLIQFLAYLWFQTFAWCLQLPSSLESKDQYLLEVVSASLLLRYASSLLLCLKHHQMRFVSVLKAPFPLPLMLILPLLDLILQDSIEEKNLAFVIRLFKS